MSHINFNEFICMRDNLKKYSLIHLSYFINIMPSKPAQPKDTINVLDMQNEGAIA